ncbi:hypothetical protein ACXIVK_27930 [Paraburkholderia caledonica]
MAHAHNPGDAVANLFGVGSIGKVIREVQEAMSRWPEFPAATGVDGAETSRIQSLLCR